MIKQRVDDIVDIGVRAKEAGEEDAAPPQTRVGFLPAETCFCQTCGLNRFKPEKTWKLVSYRYE